MSTLIAIPDELVEQVKSVAQVEAVEKFFINAARKQVREIRARQLRKEYDSTHRRLTPSEVYVGMLSDVVAFETQYGLSSDQFLDDFESGLLEEDSSDWVAFYRWRTMAHGLRRMEQEYGFTREAQARDDRQI